MDTIQRIAAGDDNVDLAQPLLNAANVAELLGIPVSSVYDYARRKHDPLPSVGIGRHRRFLRRDVEAWLTAHRSV
jgi:excisionase family DNA binding protein